MINRHRALKTAMRAAGMLFTVGSIFLIVGGQGGPEWAYWVGGLLFAILLFMPALLLISKPGLAVTWIDSLFYMLMWRSSQRNYAPTVPREWCKWSELTYAEKVSICLVASICLMISVLILRYTLIQILSTVNLG